MWMPTRASHPFCIFVRSLSHGGEERDWTAPGMTQRRSSAGRSDVARTAYILGDPAHPSTGGVTVPNDGRTARISGRSMERSVAGSTYAEPSICRARGRRHGRVLRRSGSGSMSLGAFPVGGEEPVAEQVDVGCTAGGDDFRGEGVGAES